MCSSIREPIKRNYPMKSRKTIPPGLVDLPPYANDGVVPVSLFQDRVMIHDADSAHRMRRAGQLARHVLDVACRMAAPGVTTEEIDDVVHDTILEHGAYPSPLRYAGFPKSCCSSVNEVICHGIPNARPLRAGDVVSFDVSCFLDGVHGDNCATVLVGDCPSQQEEEEDVDNATTEFESLELEQHFVAARRLIRATEESLEYAISQCAPGKHLYEIGGAIQDVADHYGYETVQKYRGHGIGSEFHCAPFVKHFRNKDALILRPGMIFTIEPMFTEGSQECFEWEDQWTVATVDGGWAAQFEHTVHITNEGVEILTLPPPIDEED